MSAFNILIFTAGALILLLQIFLVFRIAEMRRGIYGVRERVRQDMNEAFSGYGEMISNQQKGFYENQNQRLKELNDRFYQLSTENNRQLEAMRVTVDERLQKTLETRLGESFRTVSASLDEVSKGLGEMQHLANGIGDLKKVLSNVKTRGIIGEVQLAAILEEMLAPEQYEQDVNTKGEGNNRVEFAVRLPGEYGKTIYLPIDSKFPGETYANLQDAYDSGDIQRIKSARKKLIDTVKQEAKDINDKYIEPPKTTRYGIMFLPFEGLYAEVVGLGMIEMLQREYNVNIAGPTTLAALLSSLQMGFRTLAIQKRSNEVWNILGAVKTEFVKFHDVLARAQNNLKQADKNLDDLIGTRSRAMERKLRDITEIPVSTEDYFSYEETEK